MISSNSSIKTVCFLLFLVLFLTAVSFAQDGTSDSIKLGFSENWSDTWRPLTFPGKKTTSYEYYDSLEAICGRANQSASALVRPFPEEVKSPYLLSWQWKVDSTVPGGNARSKSGDDYTARIYLNFRSPESLSYWQSLKKTALETVYGHTIPDQSLNFIWANRVEPGQVLPSPYTDQTKLVVMRNRGDTTGVWIEETVRIGSYYRKAFGGTPPVPHSIAIMSDSDNTNASVRGCYREIKMKKNP